MLSRFVTQSYAQPKQKKKTRMLLKKGFLSDVEKLSLSEFRLLCLRKAVTVHTLNELLRCVAISKSLRIAQARHQKRMRLIESFVRVN